MLVHAKTRKERVKSLLDELTHEAVAAAIPGIKRGTIRTHCSLGVIPSSWFDGIEQLCAQKGIQCDRSLFSFKTYDEDTAA